ncbi:MAG TPA: HAD family hydrolase [Candidatus Polarisedimenticolia bacterium]|nr:HAD family hydrolase [Candidatus Polarisedimenticolia bacterium]
MLRRSAAVGTMDGEMSAFPARRGRPCLGTGLLFGVALAAACPALVHAEDSLPSWNATAPKKALGAFVERVTKPGTLDFVPPERRVAVFDNDGTLWAEQPVYFQFAFALDRVKALAPQHPEWKTQEPFASLLKGELKAALAGGEQAIGSIIAVSHAGMSVEEFDKTVRDWFRTARHPKTGRPYSEMIYQPMVELLAYLRASGFKTFIVSGGGIDFMRAFATEAYGIPPDQIVGSMGKLRYEARGGKPALIKLPEIDFVDDKEGKPVGIQRFIGLRPILAFGNSEGDRQMLEWTAAGEGPRLMGLVHHTDAAREYAYDKDSKIGTLGPTLDEANTRGWMVVDMKRDWKTVFPGDKAP